MLTCADLCCADLSGGVQHVSPYGQSLLSSSGAVRTPLGHDNYAVAFASGGSTGRMKFVYRSEWEGDAMLCYAMICSMLRCAVIEWSFVSYD